VASQEPSAAAEEAEDLAYANAALLRVTRRLDDAAGGLSELAVSLRSAGDDPEQLGAAEQVLDQIQSLKDILPRIIKRGRKHQNPGDAFSVVTQVTALVSDAEAASDRWPETGPAGPPPKPPQRSAFKVALGHLKEALPHLGAYLPPDHAGAADCQRHRRHRIFGIASATITVTFGKA
jgi:hypothetical protein